ncbi:hypothetical protein TCON_1950 [Astathelohania contejeani]|uniref:Uncharacterized protein n=1 Tax=Astathelohania contejeani TaxID=164912 RepID=A0ABQ7HXG7_9MICR|nr:hypothetical protein TCON_1950 [Thelohania contejeani]
MLNKKPRNIYKYYSEYIVKKLECLPLEHQIDILKLYDVHPIILDFDGLLLNLYPLLSTIDHDYYCIYDSKECKEELNDILNSEEIKLILSKTERVDIINNTTLIYKE